MNQLRHPRLQLNRAAGFLIAAAILGGAAQHATAHGDLHERIVALTEQLRTNRTNPDLWLRRADLHRQHGEFKSAQADIGKAARLKPAWAATSLQRARVFFDMGKLPDAISAATDCLKLDSSNADALVIRARTRARLGKFAAAAADYDRVLSDTNNARPLPDLFIERARTQAAQGRLGDAIRGLDDAQKRFGETPSFALPAIEYERQRGNFTAALERLERAKNFFNADSHARLREEILKQAHRQ